jgi:hypothetical protein
MALQKFLKTSMWPKTLNKNGVKILSVEIFIWESNDIFNGRCLVGVTLHHQPQQDKMVNN